MEAEKFFVLAQEIFSFHLRMGSISALEFFCFRAVRAVSLRLYGLGGKFFLGEGCFGEGIPFLLPLVVLEGAVGE